MLSLTDSEWFTVIVTLIEIIKRTCNGWLEMNCLHRFRPYWVDLPRLLLLDCQPMNNW
jgi:hypothetical protein